MKSLVVLCVFVAAARAQDLAPLVQLSRPVKNAQLSSIREDGVEFLDANVIELFGHDELVRWGSLPDKEQADQVVLRDGSILVGTVTSISRTQIVLETDVWGELSLDRDLVVSVIWKLPTDSLKRTKFRDSLILPQDDEARKERLLMRNGDFLDGRLLEGSDALLKFQTDVGEIDLRSDLVAAWRSRTPADASPTSGVVGLRDGTKLVTDKIRANDRIEADLQCGFHVGSLLEIRPIDERLITYVRFNNPNVKYLSDIEPLGHKHIPFLTTSWSWGRDRSVVGGQLRSASHTFDKGIGMHSTSRLAFDLPEGFDEFQAEACIDRSAGKGGSVVFRVFTSQDGSKWDVSYKSDIVRGGDKARPIRVRLRAAKRMALVVDFAERGDQLDRANWVGARLVRLPSK